MALQLYNTLSARKEPFIPKHAGRVGIYVCGPTVYSQAHIGHARSAVFYDVLVRYLEAKGFQVCWVRNITDVDDKIIQKAAQCRKDYRHLAAILISDFQHDMQQLNIRKPTHEPRASAYIGTMQGLISALLQSGHAYRSGGDVFFGVDTIENYGALSDRTPAATKTGLRIPSNPAKRNPFDFALWKGGSAAEPGWESPWGRGRPGWHIECTAMSSAILGTNFDIHGGGMDLIFPHHENEMAQSLGAFQTVPANWWVHHGLVNFGGRKMSKSAGVPVTIRSITAEFHPEALRLYLLDRSYRRPLEYSRCALYEAAARLNRFYFFLNQSQKMLGTLKSASPLRGWIWQRFCEALDDDVDIARGLSILFQAVGNLNRRLYAGRLHRGSAETEKLRRECAEVVGILKGVVGILGQRPQDYIGTNTVLQNSSPFFSRADIESLLAKRLAARKAGQWEKADQIRKQLAARAVQIRDAADGSRWKLGKICGFIPYQP